MRERRNSRLSSNRMTMIDQVDALKARKITSLMVAYLFENKKQIADGRKKKKKKTTRKEPETRRKATEIH